MLNYNSVKADLIERMDKAIEALKGEFAGLRAGRAHASLLDGIMVEVYGSMTPLSQIGSIGVPDARTLSVSIWDKSISSKVERAIRDSNLGLNPVSDGQLIRIPVPPLSQERRVELGKIASKYSENSKISIRNIRRDILDAIKSMKKDNIISEDDEVRHEKEVQKFVDEYTKKIEEQLELKEKDIMQV